jgi:transposase
MQALFLLRMADLIDIYFADESGFSLTPNIPYGWQPIGKQVAIPTERKKVANIFGLLDPIAGKLITYATKKTANIDTNFMIECIEDFLTRCTKPTVIILDNAPWHTSEEFKNELDEWMEKDLYIFYLPKYSPHLNLIETLWRKVKYEWLRPKDYNSKTALKRRIKEIFNGFGTKFSINFSMNVFVI